LRFGLRLDDDRFRSRRRRSRFGIRDRLRWGRRSRPGRWLGLGTRLGTRLRGGRLRLGNLGDHGFFPDFRGTGRCRLDDFLVGTPSSEQPASRSWVAEFVRH
jgi:hypothetical protein